MAGSLALDTSVVVKHLRKNDAAVKAELAGAEELYVPLTTLGELHYGVKRSGDDPRAVAQLGEFMREAVVLLPDESTAKTFATLKNFLADKGKLIPENDLWIAATAKSHDLTLYCDDAHFDELKELMDIKQVVSR